MVRLEELIELLTPVPLNEVLVTVAVGVKERPTFVTVLPKNPTGFPVTVFAIFKTIEFSVVSFA